MDEFDQENLHLAWNFRRFPTTRFFELIPEQSLLRFHLNAAKFGLRKRYNLMGFRQKESDFRYEVKMNFNPTDELSEAGMSIFQQDDNYLNFVLRLEQGQPKIMLHYKAPEKNVNVLLDQAVKAYRGEIIFQLISKNDQYNYAYSLDNGQTYHRFYTSDASLVLCKGYIGTNLGVYATSKLDETDDFVDFDWVNYTGITRK